MGFNPLITVLNFEKKSTSKSKQELQPFFFAKNAIYICQINFQIFEISLLWIFFWV
jgi:hypothetical protein